MPDDKERGKEAYALQPEQAARLLNGASAAPGQGPRNRAILHFFWATGVRRAELINLKLSGLDLSKCRATAIGKEDQERVALRRRPAGKVLMAREGEVVRATMSRSIAKQATTSPFPVLWCTYLQPTNHRGGTWGAA